jgi:hypothetical protein
VGKARVVPIAIAITLGLSLFADSTVGVQAAQRGGDLCVAVSGGTISNETVLDLAADGGTAISDSSGGQGNIAARGGGNRRNNNRNNNNNRRNRNNFMAEPLDSFAVRLQQTDTASAGNAGVATASANGGVISVGDINSGGNSGNAISIGDTVCPGAAHGGGKPSGGGVAPSGGRGGVRALPKTGVGLAETGAGALLCAIGALGFAGLSLGRRFDLRFSRVGNR